MVGASGSGFAVGFPEHCGRRLQQRAVVVVVLNLQSFSCRGGYTHKCEELASVGSGAPARLPAAFSGAKGCALVTFTQQVKD